MSHAKHDGHIQFRVSPRLFQAFFAPYIPIIVPKHDDRVGKISRCPQQPQGLLGGMGVGRHLLAPKTIERNKVRFCKPLHFSPSEVRIGRRNTPPLSQ